MSKRFGFTNKFPRPLRERVRERGKNAFTLAEVLITLAIIGVVAAMTIPTLVASYQEKSWGTAATVFERKLTEALKVMNVQGTLAGYQTTESFVEELSKHFKTTKICANDKLQDCFSSEVTYGNEAVDMTKVKTAKHFGQDDWGTNIVGTQFANGTTALIAYNPACSQDPYSNQVVTTDCIAILYDTSGFKSPNQSGKDLRSINVVSLGGNECIVNIGSACFGAPKVVESWDAAVAYCGGTNKLPTREQLTALAKDIYETDEIGQDEYNTDLNWNSNKVSAYGFNTSAEYVQIWSGLEYNDNRAYGRVFGQNVTSDWGEADKEESTFYAMCLN